MPAGAAEVVGLPVKDEGGRGHLVTGDNDTRDWHHHVVEEI